MTLEPSIKTIYTFEEGEISNYPFELSELITLNKDEVKGGESVFEILFETKSYGLLKWSYRDRYSRDNDYNRVENLWLKI